MKRLIIDYSKLNQQILDLLVEKFPDGYNFNDIMSFQTSTGETIKAIEVRTDDSIYLVKISTKLEKAMEDYSDDNLDDDLDGNLDDDLDEDFIIDEFDKMELE
jgi:hypothetical protein